MEILTGSIVRIIKKTDTMYKKRSWGKETILDKVFNSLWLAYGPIIK